jgi:hypothetical protein
MYEVQITAGVLEEIQDQSYSRLQIYQVPMCTRCRVIACRDVHQVSQIKGNCGKLGCTLETMNL